MGEGKTVEIIEFTDPVCTWCWGSEPVLRKLETRYGDQVQVKFVMGGLVKDIRTFYDSQNDIGLDPERSNRQIARHWVEASAKHGMPVDEAGLRLFSEEHPSSYPQNIAYKAAQMESQGLADRFLRRMREASAAEARQTSRQEVLVELASEVGLDVARFLERLGDGSAEAAFQQDLDLVRQHGVRGFPTFLIRYGDREQLLRSYQSYESFQVVIRTLTNDQVRPFSVPRNEEFVQAFIDRYGRVAMAEIQTAFDLSPDDAESMVRKIERKNRCRTVPAGNSAFVESVRNPMGCNPDEASCSLR